MEHNNINSVDDHGLNTDMAQSSAPNTEPLGHQGGNQTGGNDKYHRVLWCDNMDLAYNYGKIFEMFKEFGSIERIKVKLIARNFQDVCLQA